MGLSNEVPARGASLSAWSTQPSPSVDAEGWQASLQLAFDQRGARSVLARAEHRGPLRVQRPFYPEPNGTCHVYMLHPPGGVAGGDRLRTDVFAGAGARALLTTPGATKLYRSRGPTAHVTQRVSGAAGACIEWLPQETIAFEGAMASLDMQVDLEPGAVFAGWEIVCLGRPACRERFGRGRLRTSLRIRRGSVLRYVERGDYAGGDPVLDAAWGLGGAPVFGLFAIAHERADGDWLECARSAVVAADGLFALTLVSGVVLGRYLGRSTLDARACFESMFAALRPRYAGSSALTPRIWRT